MSNLDDFLAGLNPKVAKSFKKASETHTEVLPLASYRLTKALNGGIGRNRVALVYGNTSAGKSTLAMQSVAKWQEMGLVCAYVDVEKTWDNKWAEKLGVNTDDLLLIQQVTASRVNDSIAPLLQGGIDAIVIDSVSMIMPDGFADEDGLPKALKDQKQMGAQAKAISTLMNSIHGSNDRTAVMVLSQTTTEIGQTYTKQVPHGGKKLMFASSQIVKLTSSNTDAKQIKGQLQIGNNILSVPIGRKVEASVEKNKIGPQGGACEYDLYYNGKFVGIDYVGEVVDEAVKYGIINKSGAWFSMGDQKWQGRDSIVKDARKDDGFLAELEKEIIVVEDKELV